MPEAVAASPALVQVVAEAQEAEGQEDHEGIPEQLEVTEAPQVSVPVAREVEVCQEAVPSPEAEAAAPAVDEVDGEQRDVPSDETTGSAAERSVEEPEPADVTSESVGEPAAVDDRGGRTRRSRRNS